MYENITAPPPPPGRRPASETPFKWRFAGEQMMTQH